MTSRSVMPGERIAAIATRRLESRSNVCRQNALPSVASRIFSNSFSLLKSITAPWRLRSGFAPAASASPSPWAPASPPPAPAPAASMRCASASAWSNAASAALSTGAAASALNAAATSSKPGIPSTRTPARTHAATARLTRAIGAARFANIAATIAGWRSRRASSRTHSSRSAAPAVAAARAIASSAVAGLASSSAIPLIDQRQPAQRQHVVALLDGLRLGGNQRRQPAGADHTRLKIDLALDARHDRVDETGVAEHQPRLDAGHRVAPDGVLGPRDLHARQLGGRVIERVGRDHQPGRDHAARVLAARRDHIERGRGAEVDDDRALRPALMGRDRVDDAVGADLARVLVQDRHSRLRARAHDQRLDAQV